MLGSYRGGSPMAKRPRMNEDFGRMKHEQDDGHNGGGSMRPGILPMVGGGGMGGPGGDFGGPPSMTGRVLQVRGLPENTMEADLVDALSHFGPVSYVSLTNRGTGLIEFEDPLAAERCVGHNRTTDILVLNKPAYFSYANMQVIPRQGLESDRPSNVLIFYVQNPKYPITPDIIHAIVKPIGRVNRIIVNRQSGIQALVELFDIDNARITKQRLNGCDIYSGCCTLKIEYAKMQRLNTVPNNVDHADYVTGAASSGNGNPLGFDELGRPIYGDPAGSASGVSGGNVDVKPMQGGGGMGGIGNPPFGGGMVPGRGGIGLMDDYQSAAQAQMAALNATGGMGGGGLSSQQHSQPAFVGGAQPPFGAIGSQGGMMMGIGAGGSGYMGPAGGNPGPDRGPPSMRQFQDRFPPYNEPSHHGDDRSPNHFVNDRPPHQFMNERADQRLPDGCGTDGENAVLMIYGVDPEKVNCDKLFNLFCLYGNVMRIKFLKSKNDTVMIQMGDSMAAQRAMDCLRHCSVFGKPLHMALSRQSQLKPVHGEPLELPDKTTSYRDYSSVRLNRFLTPEIAAKNRINAPQKTLYFFNAPPGIDEDRLYRLLDDHKAPKPADAKVFSQRGPHQPKNSAGTIDFEDESLAVEALMLCNHALMDHEGSNSPFVLKLCFAGPVSTSAGGPGGRDGDRGRRDNFGGRDRDRDRGDRDRDRDYGARGDRYSDRREGDGGRPGPGHYNGPAGPRLDRDRRGGSRERDRERDRDGGRGDFGRGRGRGRGFGRGGR